MMWPLSRVKLLINRAILNANARTQTSGNSSRPAASCDIHYNIMVVNSCGLCDDKQNLVPEIRPNFNYYVNTRNRANTSAKKQLIC